MRLRLERRSPKRASCSSELLRVAVTHEQWQGFAFAAQPRTSWQDRPCAKVAATARDWLSRLRELRQWRFLCALTFELRRPRRQTPLGRGRTITDMAWSGQAVAAVAGRRLERGVRPRSWRCRLRGMWHGSSAPDGPPCASPGARLRRFELWGAAWRCEVLLRHC